MPYHSSDNHVFLIAWLQPLARAGETTLLQALLHTCLCCYNGRASGFFRCLLIPPLVLGVTLARLDTRSSCSSSNNRRGAMGVMPAARISLTAQDVRKMCTRCHMAVQYSVNWQYTVNWQYNGNGSTTQQNGSTATEDLLHRHQAEAVCSLQALSGTNKRYLQSKNQLKGSFPTGHHYCQMSCLVLI
jgi:hypothetical protein